MSIRKLIFSGLLALSVVAGSALAQTATPLVPTSEFYFDEDARTTRPIIAVEGSGDPLVQELLKAISRNPRAKAETAQLAHVAMAGGRPELGRELYGRVLGQIDARDGLYRAVLWNYGWDLFRIGDHAGALAQWQTLLTSRNITADWMPTTLALALWQLDRRDEAVRWYAAAVRSEPARWSTTEQYAALLPGWREEERALLAEVQQAWAADPPEWR
jgi:tetratricopeptide (TPR) repeat protein